METFRLHMKEFQLVRRKTTGYRHIVLMLAALRLARMTASTTLRLIPKLTAES
jgi:hypothetical protein